MCQKRYRRLALASMMILFAMLTARNTAFAQGGATNTHAPIFRGDALMLTAERYADDFDVSIDEALTRLRNGDEIRKLQEYLSEQYPDEFAGLWVQHKPEYRITVLVINVGKIHDDERIAVSPVKEYLTIANASVSLSQLRSTQKKVQAILFASDIPFEAGINIVENSVDVYSTSVLAIHKTLLKADVTIPSYVRLIQVDQLSQLASDIYAGLDLDTCTSGFSVLHDDQSEGILGISTAGHCGCSDDHYCSCQNSPCSNTDPIYYNGTLLPLQGVEFHNSYDVEWHTTPGYTARNLFFDGTYNVYVYGIRTRAEQYVGEYVCKYGIATGAGCGTISDLYYYWSDQDGYFVRIHNDSTSLADLGDSGGPWYQGNIAYGITSARIPNNNSGNNDALYMPVDKYDILDLCILRDEANPTVPVLNAVLENGAVTLTWIHNDDVCGYEIHRSESPYFTPSETSLVIRITANVSSFSSGLGVGDTNHNYYYRIKAITGSDSFASNTEGEFDFSLTPGQ